jgi:hypothetical protein
MAKHEFSEEDRDKLINSTPDPLSVLDEIESGASAGLRDASISITGFYDAACDHAWIEVTKYNDPHRNYVCAQCPATLWTEWGEATDG